MIKNKKLHSVMNPKTLKLLRKKGLDSNEYWSITNVFYASNLESLADLERLLIESGWQITEKTKSASEDQPNKWCLMAQRDFLLTLKNLNVMTDKCIDLAESSNSEYDGWFVEI